MSNDSVDFQVQLLMAVERIDATTGNTQDEVRELRGEVRGLRSELETVRRSIPENLDSRLRATETNQTRLGVMAFLMGIPGIGSLFSNT